MLKLFKKGNLMVQYMVIIIISSMIAITVSYALSEFIRYYNRNKFMAEINRDSMFGLEKIKKELSQSRNVNIINSDYIFYTDLDYNTGEIYLQNDEIIISKNNKTIVVMDNVNTLQFDYADIEQDTIQITIELSNGATTTNIDTVIFLRTRD